MISVNKNNLIKIIQGLSTKSYYFILENFKSFHKNCSSQTQQMKSIPKTSISFDFYHLLSSTVLDRKENITISQQKFVLMKTSWRRLEDVFRLHLQKTSSRCFQDVLVKTKIFVLTICLQDIFKMPSRRFQDVFKTSSRRLAKTSSRRFQDVFKTPCHDVFKTFWRRLQDVFKTSSRPLQGVFKTSSRRFEDIFKGSSRHLQDVLKRYLQDVFKAYHQVNLF